MIIVAMIIICGLNEQVAKSEQKCCALGPAAILAYS